LALIFDHNICSSHKLEIWALSDWHLGARQFRRFLAPAPPAKHLTALAKSRRKSQKVAFPNRSAERIFEQRSKPGRKTKKKPYGNQWTNYS